MWVYTVLSRVIVDWNNQGEWLFDKFQSKSTIFHNLSLPLLGRSIAGTTDSPTEVSPNPHAREEDIRFILKEVKDYLSPDISGEDTAISSPPDHTSVNCYPIVWLALIKCIVAWQIKSTEVLMPLWGQEPCTHAQLDALHVPYCMNACK